MISLYQEKSFRVHVNCSLTYKAVCSTLTKKNSKFDEQIYVWQASPDFPLYFDKHETVRLRIEQEIWTDQTPIGPKDEENSKSVRSSPYVLHGSMQEAGLGPCLWWDDAEEDVAEE